ncbi:MAG: HEAT repeat domain-containing protein [Acidobacteria bacterium]|nr:HEAT repeat domain-containing protein [Acidobacteriota bacterium]
MRFCFSPHRNSFALALRCAVVLVAVAMFFSPVLRADEPYGRSRDYDLQNARIALRFDLDQRKIIGEVTHTLAPVRDGLTQLDFDSVDLTINSVTVGGQPAKFETTPQKLLVTLGTPARAGEKLTVQIRYEGRPKKGIYFVLPDKYYPDQPKQVWTQGESEDTRYYIPIYDYPNDLTATEMILTVPANWTTVSNGKLLSVKDEAGGMKTWSWKQSAPHATYLISIVAGEFDEGKEMWRGIPVIYYAPKGRGERIPGTFVHTTKMLDFFSDKLGVKYPWDKYAQTTVDDFIVGGMENTSATTNTSASLVHPQLANEDPQNSDDLIAHEMAHQWFGDLLTCKDWANLWLNEGFATYFESLWEESYYGADEFSYSLWRSRNGWMQDARLFGVPIITRNFSDSVEYGGNIYTKGGWVLHMLRRDLGDAGFYRAMKHYLEKYRHQNVVTADLTQAIEEATGRNVDRFFDQWVYGAGAPKFEVSYTYDETAHQLKLDVKQTQKVEGRVGLFRVPVEVEVTTGTGKKSFPISVSQASEAFTFPVDSTPLLVLFDKGGNILKSLDFKKGWKEWIYQLKNADAVSDRADAAKALGEIKNNDEVTATLGDAARGDKHWGVRVRALRALGSIGGSAAQKQVTAAFTANEQAWVRAVAVQLMGDFKDDPSIGESLEKLFREEKTYRVRTAALHALGQQKSKNAFDVLKAAAAMDSIDNAFRATALKALGTLGDDRAVPILEEATAPGQPMSVRSAAFSGLGQLDKKNKEIMKKLVAYLDEPNRTPRFYLDVIGALSERGDTDALSALDAWLQHAELPIGASFVRGRIDRLRKQAGGAQPAAGAISAQPAAAGAPPAAAGAGGGAPSNLIQPGQQIMQTLEQIQKENAEIKERLKKLEEKAGAAKP